MILVLVISTLVFAATTKTINVTASIPTMNGTANITVSKIRASDNFWLQSDPTLPIDFGTLTFDSAFSVFRATYYYAVDIGVNDNTGTNWTITHNISSVKKDATNNLDNNINVSFMKQINDTNASQLQKVSFSNSQGVTYDKNILSGGWLRVYYGLGTGKDDASGVLPITVSKPAGSYAGSVTITIAP